MSNNGEAYDFGIQAEYLNHMGDDLTVVNAARVSLDKWKDQLDADDLRLIDFLASGMTSKQRQAFLQQLQDAMLNGDDWDIWEMMEEYRNIPTHWSPFAHVQVQFRMTAPIFVRSQWFRHTVGFARNEVSRRYISKEPDFWSPDNGWWREAPKDAKQGSGSAIVDKEADDTITTAYDKHCKAARWLYQDLVGIYGMAPEQARAVLPQSMLTTWIETGSLYAYANLCRQRLRQDTQDETRQLARQVANVMHTIAPWSWDALVGELPH